MLGWALLSVAAFAAPTFPTLSGRVVDEAGLLSARTEQALVADLAGLEAQTGAQLVVVTLPDLQGYPIEEFGYQLGRHWGIGRADEDDGVLLIVAEAERKVRIEVGYGLEGVLTDAWSSVTIRRVIVPRFRQGDFDGGVLAGSRAIVEQLGADPETQRARVRDAARPRARDDADQLAALLPFLIILFVLLVTFGGRGRGRGIYVGGGSYGGGGWSGGGGGGFSGGGGSFGGGGASGGW
ncbi:MAG: TPM domain-containing protein [Myxococcota bacterium]